MNVYTVGHNYRFQSKLIESMSLFRGFLISRTARLQAGGKPLYKFSISLYPALSVAKKCPYMYLVHLSIFCLVALSFLSGFLESRWLFCMPPFSNLLAAGDLPSVCNKLYLTLGLILRFLTSSVPYAKTFWWGCVISLFILCTYYLC